MQYHKTETSGTTGTALDSTDDLMTSMMAQSDVMMKLMALQVLLAFTHR